MKRWTGAGVLALAAAIAAGAVAPSPAKPALVAAINARCNNNVTGTLERQVRAYDRRPPAANVDALTQRFADLDSILQQAQLERDILQNMCTNDESPPINNQLAGVVAWAYALQADIAAKRFALLNCPVAVTSVPPALLASGWYALATTLNESTAPPAPAPLVAEVMPKIRARAAAVGLTLPPFSDTSQYWRDTLVAKALGCPSPSPSPH
jgi:hypothetical protein